MSGIASFVVGNTALALGAALVVLALQRWLRPRPATMHSLWLLVLLQLCWPTRLRFDVPLLPTAASVEVDGSVPAPTAAPSTAAPASAPTVRSGGPRAGVLAGIAERAPERATGSAIEALPWLWLGGSTASLLVLLALVARGSLRIRRADAAPAWLRGEVAALSRTLGLRAPIVLDDAAATTPFVWPFGWPLQRPRVVGSASVLAALPPPVRSAVLAHELGHIVRRDHLWLQLELLLAVALFWHPLFWYLRARLREQSELACDAWALWAVPEARLGYARTLVDALDSAHPAPSVPVLAARPAARRAFERRLSMILQNPVPCRLSRWAFTGIAAMGLGVAVAPVRAQQDERPRVEIRVDGVRIEDLNSRQRERLLRELGLEGEALRLALQARNVAGDDPGGRDRERAAGASGDRAGRDRQPPPAEERGALRSRSDGGAGSRQFRSTLGGILGEVRRELQSDPDLRELGITDEVVGLVDSLQSGGDFGGALERVIDQAITGAGRMAVREIESDADLKQLGIADDISRLVSGLLRNDEVRQNLSGLAKKAMRSALQQARSEIESDPDLRKLGITSDVVHLIDGLQEGRLDLDGLEPLIEKAVHGAIEQSMDRDGESKPSTGRRTERRR